MVLKLGVCTVNGQYVVAADIKKRTLVFYKLLVSVRPPSVDGNDLWRDNVERLNNVLVPHGEHQNVD